LDKSFRDSESSAIRQFIENIIHTDQGFGELPYATLSRFAGEIQQKYGVLPNPLDPTWEQVMELASTSLIDDPEDV
jgi:hypothetical protein